MLPAASGMVVIDLIWSVRYASTAFGYAITFMYPESYSHDCICPTSSARLAGAYSASCFLYSSSYFLSQMKLSVVALALALVGRAAQVWMPRTKSGSGLTDQPSKARSYSPAYQGTETSSR